MKYPTYSMDHSTKRLSLPKGVPRRCPLCGAKIKFVGAGQGKIVHTLEGPVNEVPNMYVCRNPACQLHRHWFNPHPRFEYGGRHLGADVFKLVADEVLSFKADPEQIYLCLKKTYGVRISLRTVQRMCNDGATESCQNECRTNIKMKLLPVVTGYGYSNLRLR